MLKKLFLIIFLFITSFAFAADNELNLYIWYGEVPDSVILQFQKETGIKVNYSTYNSNETLYAKLKSGGNPGYDVIQPSGYFVDKMRHENLLEPLDKVQLSNYHHLDPNFLNPSYDPDNHFSLPYIWGTTGIFVNSNRIKIKINGWQDFWRAEFAEQLLLLNDPRDIFPMALKILGYSANDHDPVHITQAYEKLRKLLPNVKLFNSDAVTPILTDEEANIGMTWNGDLYRAAVENPYLNYIYPAEGFVIWVDAFAIPKDAPHPENAYKFLNFMMRPEIAAQGTLQEGYAVANRSARLLLPLALQQNAVLYPSAEILKKGEFQVDIPDPVLESYERYWELLKIG